MRKELVVKGLFSRMKNDDNLEYATHNERVCRYLDKKSEFSDWVITTAFYSALHFVRYKIFPITIQRNDKSVKISDFEQYYRINNPQNRSKHSLLSDLVDELHPDVANDYNKLRDISWSARYHNYKFPREVSNDAKKRLERIKSYCSN